MMESSPDNEFIMFDMRLRVLATYQITAAVQYSPREPVNSASTFSELVLNH